MLKTSNYATVCSDKLPLSGIPMFASVVALCRHTYAEAACGLFENHMINEPYDLYI